MATYQIRSIKMHVYTCTVSFAAPFLCMQRIVLA